MTSFRIPLQDDLNESEILLQPEVVTLNHCSIHGEVFILSEFRFSLAPHESSTRKIRHNVQTFFKHCTLLVSISQNGTLSHVNFFEKKIVKISFEFFLLVN